MLYNIFNMVETSSKINVERGLEKRTLVDQVYDYLQNRIVSFSLKPGEKIDVKRLSQELSVSQTPVREALHRLVEQGLVVSKPYVGYFVVQLTPKDIQELFDLRKSLELLALKYVIENVNAEFLHDLLRRAKKLERQKSLEAFVEETRKLDEDLHLEFLIKSSGNKWLVKFANGIIDLIKLTTCLSINPKAACAEHRKILEAVAKHDLEKAVFALETHLERAKQDSIAAWQERREQM